MQTVINTSNITQKGQVTLPVAMRRLLGLEPGQQVSFTLSPNHQHIVVEPVKNDITAVFGMLKAECGVTLDEMDTAAGTAAVERFNAAN